MADLKISQFTDGGAIQTTDEIATNRGGENTKVFVGSAAALDAGLAIGDVVQIVDIGGGIEGLPVLDGSNLLNIPGSSIVDVGVLLTKDTEIDSAGQEIIILDVRSQSATAQTIGTGTCTVNIANGDLHKITATGIFTFSWVMSIGQSVLVKGVAFNTYTPIDGLDWGDAGAPTWTGEDDFIVYRDYDGTYNGALIISGL